MHRGALLGGLIALWTGGSAMATLRPVLLRCEYRVNPLGIEERQPRLSWLLETDQPQRRGQRQTAYQILVASSEANLRADRGDLWDSGRVASEQTSHIPYAGKPLTSGMECWWKVRVWDQEGQVSPWSEPARWSMGLLEPQDWQARWIGYDAPAGEDEPWLTFEGCRWIWFPEGNPRQEAPAATRYFRRRFPLPADRTVRQAHILLTADDQFELFINGKSVRRSDGQPDAWQRPQVVDITPFLQPGLNGVAIAATNAGGPAGLLVKIVVSFAEGQPLVVVSDRGWKASAEAPAGWERVDLEDASWPSAQEVARFGEAPWGVIPGRDLYLPPLPFLRKTFTVEKPLRRAMLYVSALGSCEIRLNGRRASEDYFIPGWSDFRKRAYYRTYEVTPLLRQGENALGAILADEWYAGYCGGWGKRNFYGGEPRLLVQLEMEFADGTRQRVVSDGTWKATYGPILEADFYHGETYDARREMPGWDSPGFDDRLWEPVVVTEKVNLTLTAHPGEPVRKVAELPAQKVSEPQPGVFIFDLGQNMVGVARLRVRGAPAGTRIRLRFAEMLNPDGTLYTANLRRARNTDTYICKGEAEEVWEPRHTFRGFRYVEVTGYPGRPPLEAITGIVLHSDVPMVGEFTSSHPLLNRLVENIRWGLRGNYLEVPTDCPQRDERQGWTGDAQIFVRTASYLADVASFMTKWLMDLEDGQREDGAYPDVAPVTGAGFGTPAWGDAAIIVPYTLYRVYGDRRIIERHYSAMARAIEYLQRNSQDLLRPDMGYGDWVPAGPATPKDVLATAYFAYVVHLMAEMAEAIGRTEDAQRYRHLFAAIQEAFVRAYVQPDGRIKGETQTAYALALDLDLLPDPLKPLALQHLVADIERRGWHLATGFVGTRHLMRAISRFGRTDVAYRLLLQETYPSWLYMVRMGATTIWERWDSWTEERGFQDPGMNSFNHYAFGCVGEWLFSVVAGIESDGPGFRRLLLQPRPGEGLNHVRARYRSLHGEIVSEWRVEKGVFRWDLTVPVNTTATVVVPTRDPAAVKEGGQPAAHSPGVEFLRAEEGSALYRVGSGRYTFEAPL